jgi:hypothetical protein
LGWGIGEGEGVCAGYFCGYEEGLCGLIVSVWLGLVYITELSYDSFFGNYGLIIHQGFILWCFLSLQTRISQEATL